MTNQDVQDLIRRALCGTDTDDVYDPPTTVQITTPVASTTAPKTAKFEGMTTPNARGEIFASFSGYQHY